MVPTQGVAELGQLTAALSPVTPRAGSAGAKPEITRLPPVHVMSNADVDARSTGSLKLTCNGPEYSELPFAGAVNVMVGKVLIVNDHAKSPAMACAVPSVTEAA